MLVSGLTVMTAMSGMFLMGTRVFQGFGVGTVLVVAIALVGSLTVLPAIISKLGDRIDRGRLPFLRRLVARDGEVALLGRDRRRRAAPTAGVGVLARRSWSPWRSRRSACTPRRPARRVSRATCRS